MPQPTDLHTELSALLANLPGERFCYLDEGALKTRLITSYSDQDGAHAEILDFEHNASLRITPAADSAAAQFVCRLEAGEFQYQVKFAVAAFSAAELRELLELLRPECPPPPKPASHPGKVILRKQPGRGLLNTAAAATALGLSQRSLKTLIPCSEVRVASDGGDRSLKEFYWEQTLVDSFVRLAAKQQTGRGYNREELTFIADNCCDGDRRWARDCIDGYLQQLCCAEPATDDRKP